MQITDERVERLQAALNRIEKREVQHAQDVWCEGEPDDDGIIEIDCASFRCLAGDIVLASGEWVPIVPFIDMTAACEVIPVGRVEEFRRPGVATVPRTTFSEAAAKLLGLDEDEAGDLFSGANTVAELWIIAHELTDRRIELPERITCHLPARYSNNDLREAAAAAVQDAIDAEEPVV